jgi:hypothetical protein
LEQHPSEEQLSCFTEIDFRFSPLQQVDSQQSSVRFTEVCCFVSVQQSGQQSGGQQSNGQQSGEQQSGEQQTLARAILWVSAAA